MIIEFRIEKREKSKRITAMFGTVIVFGLPVADIQLTEWIDFNPIDAVCDRALQDSKQRSFARQLLKYDNG